jgi:hypothetical protein
MKVYLFYYFYIWKVCSHYPNILSILPAKQVFILIEYGYLMPISLENILVLCYVCYIYHSKFDGGLAIIGCI